MKSTVKLIIVLMAAVCALPAAATSIGSIELIGRYEGTYLFDGDTEHKGAEISAYDIESKRLFITGSIEVNPGGGNEDHPILQVVDIADPTNPTFVTDIDLATLDSNFINGGVQSVASKNGLIAAAIRPANSQADGTVAFFDAATLAHKGSITVGALPDMLTFTPDGTKVLVANEGEPSDDYTNDPLGTISIVDLNLTDLGNSTVQSVDFTSYNGAALDASVRVFGPGATVAQDFEPEYIAISEDGTTAFVSLQENNALAIIDIANAGVKAVHGLGFKDHSDPRNALDINKNDNDAIIQAERIFGMYQPDAIATYEVGGVQYIVTANEGDARDYDGYSEEEDLSKLGIDPGAFSTSDYNRYTDGKAEGDLKVTITNGDGNNDGLYEDIYAFGGRSFSIYDENGNQVYDSEDDFEQITKQLFFDFYNSQDGDAGEFDDRSDNKGPEPEGLALGRIGSSMYAFITLERTGGIMVYNITDPTNVYFVKYILPALNGAGDKQLDAAPESSIFIDAKDSPNGRYLLITAHEETGTTTIHQVNPVPEPISAMLGVLGLGALSVVTRRRRTV